MHTVSCCRPLVPMKRNLLIILLQWEAVSGPAASSAVSLTLKRKALREYSQRNNKRNIKKIFALNGRFKSFCVIWSAREEIFTDILITGLLTTECSYG